MIPLNINVRDPLGGKDIIAADLNGAFPIEKMDTLKNAIIRSYEQAKPGDCVLFSPMCSSFDMFKDYEQRGEAFKKMVLDLARGKMYG